MEKVEIVNIKIDNVDELFNKFDDEDISDELASYIENRCSRTLKNEMLIKIYSEEELSDEDKDRVVTAIRSHYGIENKFLDIEIKKLQKVNIYYFVAGVLTIFVSNILPIGKFIPEIIDVLGGFIIYESSFNLLFTDNELDLKSYRATKIGKSRIIFEYKK